MYLSRPYRINFLKVVFINFTWSILEYLVSYIRLGMAFMYRLSSFTKGSPWYIKLNDDVIYILQGLIKNSFNKHFKAGI